jgi:methyltransferase
MSGLDSRVLYTALVLLVALQRLAELAVSRRHERRLRSRGAAEAGAGHYPWMVALHAALLVSCLAEVWLLDRPFVPALAAAALVVLVAATCLRVWTLRTLGERWTTRVLVLPGEALVTAGPYRYLRHPNYLAVALEVAALPLVHTAWATAVAFSALDALLLRVRIRAEEQALERASGYETTFASRSRLVPRAGGRESR